MTTKKQIAKYKNLFTIAENKRDFMQRVKKRLFALEEINEMFTTKNFYTQLSERVLFA